RATSSGRPANGLQDGFDHSFDQEGEESEHTGEAPHRQPASLKHQTSVENRQHDDAHAQRDHYAFAGAHCSLLGVVGWPTPRAPSSRAPGARTGCRRASHSEYGSFAGLGRRPTATWPRPYRTIPTPTRGATTNAAVRSHVRGFFMSRLIGQTLDQILADGHVLNNTGL